MSIKSIGGQFFSGRESSGFTVDMYVPIGLDAVWDLGVLPLALKRNPNQVGTVGDEGFAPADRLDESLTLKRLDGFSSHNVWDAALRDDLGVTR